MNDPKKLAKVLLVVGLVLTITLYFTYMKISGGGYGKGASITAQSLRGDYEMEISSHRSRPIIIGIREPLTLTWGAWREDTSYFVFINGGKENGGVEYFTPARNSRDKNWVPPEYPMKVVSVSFQLAEGTPFPTAKIAYSIW